ncbi:hypothetical protein G7046_g2472 [Stylonectria norvegica]|nr:hypothetical protein G7046_g2472 [Stylonectria norvegica]
MGFLYSQFFVTPASPTADCTGQTIIITGANTGLGKEAAIHFARLGAAKIIIAVRNVEAGEAAKRHIVARTGRSADVLEVWPLDLLSNESCKAFADRASKLPRVDVFLENAGIAGDKFKLAGGHERMVTVNVISTFYLALLMLPKLKESARKFNITPRLTVVSSEVHGHTQLPEWKQPSVFDALNDETKARPAELYPISKLLGVLAFREISPQLNGTGVIFNLLNPGLCHSELGRDAGFVFTLIKFVLARSTEVGSRTLVASAVAGPESHGKYFSDGVIDDKAVSEFARSEDGKQAGKKVWRELSEILESIQPGITSNL